MAIKRIRISNFKSFDNLDLELGNLNVLIGANASGKSNFLQIFKFLRDITQHGLKNAISLQGGVEYFRNSTIGKTRNFSLELVYNPKSGVGVEVDSRFIGIKVPEIVYQLDIEFDQKREGVKSCTDKRIHKYEFVELDRQTGEIREKEQLGTGESILANHNGNVKHFVNLPKKIPRSLYSTSLGVGEKIELSSGTLLGDKEELTLPPNTSLLETPFISLTDPVFSSTHPLKLLFDHILVYDFDPKIPKKAVPLTGKADLEEDGSNIAIVLKNIIEDEEKQRKFLNLAHYLLPFVESVQVENFSDKSLLFNLQETYNQNFQLPASFISDGTIQLIALIIALYFEDKPLIIIEEPERNIHPFLIAKLVDMLGEASAQKQIIVTTHNPEIVKHAKLENLLLVSRDKAGFSTISRPGEKKAVRTFLENEIGLTDLYVQDLLGV